MKRKQIFFTEIGKAELLEVDLNEMKDDEVLVKMRTPLSAVVRNMLVLWDLKILPKGFLHLLDIAV